MRTSTDTVPPVARPAVAGAAALRRPKTRRLDPKIGRALLYGLGIVPAVWTFALALTDQLGADPLRGLEKSLGIWSLRFLIAGLAVTPLLRLTPLNLMPYRRGLGLLAFTYAALHFGVYLWFDQGFDLAAIWQDLIRRPFIMAGMVSLAILIPLAITSNASMIKRTGAAAWKQLHRWVYLAAAAAALHFVLLVKTWQPEPLIYAGIIAALLGWRAVSRGGR